MIDKKLRDELINSGKAAVKDALPGAITTENGFTVPLAPLTDAILDLSVVGLNALLDQLVLRRVDVIGDEDTEVVVHYSD